MISRFLIVAMAGFVTLGKLTAATADDRSSPMMFRGLRLGSDMRAQLAECPTVVDQSTGNTIYADHAPPFSRPTETCWQRGTFCVGGKSVAPGQSCDEPDLVLFADKANDILYSRAYIHLLDGKLEGLSLDFDILRLKDVVELLKTKYGRPASSKTEPWKSKGGLSLSGVVIAWNPKGIVVRLKAPSSDVDTGSITVTTLLYLQSQEAARKAKVKESASDL